LHLGAIAALFGHGTLPGSPGKKWKSVIFSSGYYRMTERQKQVDAGKGLDWFWATFALDHLNRKDTHLSRPEPCAARNIKNRDSPRTAISDGWVPGANTCTVVEPRAPLAHARCARLGR
jgi:hypothetical protein